MTRDGCGYIQWFLTAVNWEKCVWFERVDRAGWTRFFFLWKILKNNFENGLVRLIVYRDYNVIELSMKKNNKKKKIERSIEHFTFYFTLSYFHENSIYTAFERAHCTGKGSTLRLRLFFSDIQILSMGSLRLNFLIDIVNLKPKKLLEPFSSKHLWTIINRIQILPRYIFFPRWFSIFLLSFRGVTVIVTNWN